MPSPTVIRFSLAVSACAAMGCTQVLGLDGLVADLDGGVGASASSGTASTTASTGSGGGCASTCDTPGCGSCPTTTPVDVPSPAGTLHVDKYETTNDEYAAFLATNPSLANQRPNCSWNDSFLAGAPSQAAIDSAVDAGVMGIDPPGGPCYDAQRLPKQIADGHGDSPVTCIDWCDAHAYCTWAGKRLCGPLGGGKTLDVTDETGGPETDPDKDEWYRACSNAGAQKMPYGDTWIPSTCNDENSGPKSVGSFTECEGGYPGLFDMSGNVTEWEDACTDYGGGPLVQNCLIRGGAYYQHTEFELSCAFRRPVLLSPPGDSNGFRCCSGP